MGYLATRAKYSSHGLQLSILSSSMAEMDRPKTAKQIEDSQQKQSDEDLNRGRPASRRGVRTPQRDIATQDAKLERTFSRGASTISSQDGSGTWRPASGIARIQGTASRLVSAASQQRTLSVSASPPRLDTQVNMTDRLITQQGLSSRARSGGTGLKGPGKRQVLDKRYFEGVLQLKIQELTNEISILRKDIENSNKEKEDFLIYDRQNKERAKELTELQGTLADYNLVIDKIHTGTEMKDIDAEYQTLKMENDAEHLKLEQLFKERTQKQQQIHQLEEEIKKERHIAEKLMENMSPEMREKYTALSNENVKLQKTIDQIQRELDTIAKEKVILEQQISSSPLKQEAARLELKLVELEEKRNTLTAEENENDPNNLQQKYLSQVKEDNAEIATMERSMNQLQDELNNNKKQLEQVEQDLEECQSDRHKKYVELRKREETIESFLSSYDNMKLKETESSTRIKAEIVKTMSAISEHLVTLPATEHEYELINKELSQIEGDSQSQGKNSLCVQYQQKQLYLEKLRTLEAKLDKEVGVLEERIDTTQSEIETFENLDALKDEAEKKRSDLQQKRQEFLAVRDHIKEELKTVKQKYEKIQKELQENETYKQLQALERKLAQIEQDNFAYKEFIADKKCEMNYEVQKKTAIELMHQYNEDLKEKYKSNLQEV